MIAVVVGMIPLVFPPVLNEGRSEGKLEGTNDGIDDGKGLDDGSADGDELVVGDFGSSSTEDGTELDEGNSETAVAGALLVGASTVSWLGAVVTEMSGNVGSG
jgi:hypothetical protein